MDQKSPLASKTIIAAVVTVIASLIGILSNGKVQVLQDDQDQITALIVMIVTALGGLGAIYGRFKATTTVSLKAPAPPAVPPAAAIAAVLLLTGGLGACSSVPVPQDVAQSVAVLDGAYLTASAAEKSYLALPTADPTVVAAMRKYDNDAYTVLLPLLQAEASGGTVDQVALAAAQTALTAFSNYVTAHQGASK